jgi:hypothetical protein
MSETPTEAQELKQQRARELANAANRRYYAKHGERLRQKNQKWRSANRESINAKNRLYIAEHRDDPVYRERRNAAGRRCYVKLRTNPDYMARQRQQSKEWRDANPERYAAALGWARARRLGAKLTGYASAAELITATMPYYAEARRLTKVTGKKYEVDHVTPLVAGGEHSPTNLEVVSRQWNCAVKAGHGTEQLLARLYSGDGTIPLLPEAVGLIYDDIEATTVAAALAGVTTPARSTLEGLLRVLTLSENAPCFSAPAVGKLIAELRADINEHTKELPNAA